MIELIGFCLFNRSQIKRHYYQGMSMNFTLNAQARTAAQEGKGASRRLRREAKVPAIIYGGDQAPMCVSLELRELVKAISNEAFFSSIITLNVDGQEQRAVIKAMQRHPAKNTPLHADFMRVVAGHEITVKVPLHFNNEETAKGVKESGGVVTINMHEVEITVLPRHLPEFITVDLQDLDVGHALHLSDLKLPEGVTITALTHGPDHDLPVASVAIIHNEADEAADMEDALHAAEEHKAELMAADLEHPQNDDLEHKETDEDHDRPKGEE